jgi:hypothetical protein
MGIALENPLLQSPDVSPVASRFENNIGLS